MDNIKMQTDNSIFGLVITGTAWLFMKFFIFIGIESLADLASVATFTSAVVVIIANIPKSMTAIVKIFNKLKKK